MSDERDPRPSASEPPIEGPARATKHVSSRVLVHTGDGKGKSSAAMGVMLRGISAGWKVAVVQFVKSGKWRSGEEAAGRSLGVEWWSLGDGFTWDSKDMDRSEAVARGAWLIEADPDLIFLADTKCCGQSPETVAERPGWDEIAAATNGGVVPLDEDVAQRWGPRVVDLLGEIAAAAETAEAAAA